MSGDAKLVSPCGLYCGVCPVHRAGSNPSLAESIGKLMNMPAEEVKCDGCRPQQGAVMSRRSSVCETYDCCVNQRKLQFCYQCDDFPCLKLAPSVHRAQELPHNSKIYNLLLIQRKGEDNFTQQAEKLWRQYFRGQKPDPGGDLRMG